MELDHPLTDEMRSTTASSETSSTESGRHQRVSSPAPVIGPRDMWVVARSVLSLSEAPAEVDPKAPEDPLIRAQWLSKWLGSALNSRNRNWCIFGIPSDPTTSGVLTEIGQVVPELEGVAITALEHGVGLSLGGIVQPIAQGSDAGHVELEALMASANSLLNRLAIRTRFVRLATDDTQHEAYAAVTISSAVDLAHAGLTCGDMESVLDFAGW